jgi:flagellar biosynthesis protein FlhF
MELQRILAKDTRSAMEQIHNLFGSDALVVSNKKARGKTEVIVAIDIAADKNNAMAELQVAAKEAPQALQSHGADFQEIMETSVFTPAFTNLDDQQKQIALPVFDHAGNTHADTVNSRGKEYLKARELVDLVKLELDAMRRELKISQQIDAEVPEIDLSPELQPLKDALKTTGMPAALRILVNDIIAKDGDINKAIETISSTFGQAIQHSDVLENMQGVHVIAGRLGLENSVMAMRLARQKAIEYGTDKVAVISFTDNQSDSWSQTQLLGLHSGIETYRASTATMLNQILAELSERDLVLIETTGIALEEKLGQLRSQLPDAKHHLVLSADASETSANRYLTKNSLKWDTVMLSQLERDVFPWPVVSALMASSVPLSLASSSSAVTKEAISLDGSTLTKQSLLNLPMSFV